MNGGVCRRELLVLRKKGQVELARHQLLVDRYQVPSVTNQSGGTHPPAERGVSSKQRCFNDHGYSRQAWNTEPGRHDGCHNRKDVSTSTVESTFHCVNVNAD